MASVTTRRTRRRYPAIVRDVDDERSLQEALVENVQRQDLNAIEEAFAFQELMEDFQLSQNDIASRVGKSRASIANTVRLLQLPGALRQLISEGELERRTRPCPADDRRCRRTGSDRGGVHQVELVGSPARSGGS